MYVKLVEFPLVFWVQFNDVCTFSAFLLCCWRLFHLIEKLEWSIAKASSNRQHQIRTAHAHFLPETTVDNVTGAVMLCMFRQRGHFAMNIWKWIDLSNWSFEQTRGWNVSLPLRSLAINWACKSRKKYKSQCLRHKKKHDQTSLCVVFFGLTSFADSWITHSKSASNLPHYLCACIFFMCQLLESVQSHLR